MLYYVNMGRVTYIAIFIQCKLDTLLNLPFKFTFFDLQVHYEHKQTVSSVYHILFCFKHDIFWYAIYFWNVLT
jgi:hypothetical protein